MTVPSAAVDIEVRQNMEVTPPQQERKRWENKIFNSPHSAIISREILGKKLFKTLLKLFLCNTKFKKIIWIEILSSLVTQFNIEFGKSC